MKRVFLFCLIGMVLRVPCMGTLEFSHTSLEFVTSVKESVHDFAFEFKNSGTRDLVIYEVKSSCGCAIVDYDDEVIVPGEAGMLRGQYELTGRMGWQGVEVRVKYSDFSGMNFEEKLKLKINVLHLVTVQPAVLHVAEPDSLDVLSFQLHVSDDCRITYLEPNEFYELDFAEAGDGVYDLKLSPKVEGAHQPARIDLYYTDSLEQLRKVSAYVSVE